MKITIPDSFIKREFEIKELKAIERLNSLEFYLENKEVFLDKYTDLTENEKQLILKEKDFLKQIINYFIDYNDIDKPKLFVKTINEFYDSLNSFVGIIIYELLSRDYKLENLLNKTKKELFYLYLFEAKLKKIEFSSKDKFENFKSFLIENYNSENTEGFLNLINPLVEGKDWNFNEEEYFEKEIESLKNL